MSRIRYILLLFALCTSIHALAVQDSLRFSLLTCEPGQEIYTLFGHTALRCENRNAHTDVVYNYGLFSFDTPNFIMKFILGLTDYRLGITPFQYFAADYAMRGWPIHQQVLNLNAEEKARLLELLETNYLPGNRVYRYNYFYDNCTTRARDQVEKALTGRLVYPDPYEDRTFRSILHEFTAGSAWDELGIDLCLGAGADKLIDERLQQFAPFYMKDYASRAYIEDADGTRRPFVTEETLVVDIEPEENWKGFPLSPLACAMLLLVVEIAVSYVQVRRRRVYWGWEALLMVGQGLAGCIVAFLFFFSIHPTVDTNWLLWIFNPIPLIYAPVSAYKAAKHKQDIYHKINIAYLTIFIVIMALGVQDFPVTVVPLALTLLAASVSHTLAMKK